MCVADLNVSLLPCHHRWYHLIRPCNPSANLSTCTQRLALEGWEIKCSFCPFCSGWVPPTGEYALLGTSSMGNICSPLSRTPSLTTTVSAARRDSRRGSLTRTDSSASLATGGEVGPVELAGQRNRDINARFDEYLSGASQRLLERGRVRSEDGGSPLNGYAVAATMTETDNEEVNGLVAKGWAKARRKSKDLSGLFK